MGALGLRMLLARLDDPTHSTAPQVFVVTSEGTLYSYHLDLEVGGECVLQKSYKCALPPHLFTLSGLGLTRAQPSGL